MKTIQRIFTPGSEWVYFKIYTGTKTADDILIRKLPSILNKSHRNGWINKWFFIRYTDPDFHLRIRFLLNNNTYIGSFINLFYNQLEPLVKNSLIWKIQLDTYNRELERYGESSMEESESVFCLDSECMIRILKKLEGKDENYRWMIALKMIDELFTSFSYSALDRLKLIESLNNSFKSEFGFDMYNSKQFNAKFRDKKYIIESVLQNKITDNYFISLYFTLKRRSKNITSIAHSINQKKEKDVSVDSLIGSYIHMMLNRLFRSKNRIHELVIYDFMYRYYKSEIAKVKYLSP